MTSISNLRMSGAEALMTNVATWLCDDPQWKSLHKTLNITDSSMLHTNDQMPICTLHKNVLKVLPFNLLSIVKNLLAIYSFIVGFTTCEITTISARRLLVGGRLYFKWHSSVKTYWWLQSSVGSCWRTSLLRLTMASLLSFGTSCFKLCFVRHMHCSSGNFH